jgi:hypothetical protein
MNNPTSAIPPPPANATINSGISDGAIGISGNSDGAIGISDSGATVGNSDGAIGISGNNDGAIGISDSGAIGDSDGDVLLISNSVGCLYYFPPFCKHFYTLSQTNRLSVIRRNSKSWSKGFGNPIEKRSSGRHDYGE